MPSKTLRNIEISRSRVIIEVWVEVRVWDEALEVSVQAPGGSGPEAMVRVGYDVVSGQDVAFESAEHAGGVGC